MKLSICEAAKFCDKKAGSGFSEHVCCYKFPFYSTHIDCMYCSYYVSCYYIKDFNFESSYNMQFIEYIHGKTRLPSSLEEINTNRRKYGKE